MNRPILFYDGDCGFCQNSVQFILQHEKEHKLIFAPLQGDYASKHLPQELTNDLNSLVILDNRKIYTKSNAALFVADSLSFPYSLAKMGKFVPLIIRDGMYKLIAQNRFKLSKGSKTCKIPTADERLRFIK